MHFYVQCICVSVYEFNNKYIHTLLLVKSVLIQKLPEDSNKDSCTRMLQHSTI